MHLGRFKESLPLLEFSADLHREDYDFVNAATQYCNISEMFVAEGNLALALEYTYKLYCVQI